MQFGDADGSGDVLERIVALLFALAALADRAAGLSCNRRKHLLCILSQGEAEAYAFLIGTSNGRPVTPASAADAAHLAARLRALGLLLCVLLAQRFALPGPAGRGVAWRRPALSAASHQPAPRAPDTS